MTQTTPYSNTLSALILMLSRSLDDCVKGVVSSTCTNTTLVCDTLLKADDYYNGYLAHIYAGVNIDTEREITDWVSSTYTLTYAPATTNVCNTSSYFMLLKKFTYDQYKDAINIAIDKGKDRYLLQKKDTSTVYVADTYEYAVPDGFRYITKIIEEDSADSGEYYEEDIISNKYWEIVRDATAPKIRFVNTYTAGADFEITGYSYQASLTNDASVCYMPTNYILQTAKAMLMSNKAEYKDILNVNLTLAEKEFALLNACVAPGSRPVFEL